jgi:GNAT superfamily N-acetyltransferase
MNPSGINSARVESDAPLGSGSAAEIVERDAWLDLFEAASPAVRDAFGLSSAGIGGIGLLASSAIPITELNRAMAVGIDGAPLTEDLGAAVEWLDRHAASGWALQVAPRVQEAARDFIHRTGLQPSGEGWAKFVQVLPATDAWQPTTAAKARTVDGSDARTFGSTVQGGFGLPEQCADWFAALVGRPNWHCFLSSLNGEPAGAAAMFTAGSAAWSGMAATLPDFRASGVQSSLVAARIDVATRCGVSVLTSETGHPATENDTAFSSYRNQKRAGFSEIYVRPNYKRPS